MKSYKEIVNEFHATDDLKQRTLDKIQNKQCGKKKSILLYASFATMILMAVFFIVIRNNGSKYMESSSKFLLSDYISDEAQANDMYAENAKLNGNLVSMDIAGTIKETKLKSFGLERMVEGKYLKVPVGYDYSERYYTWTYEDTGPYAGVSFDFQKQASYIHATIEDQRIPNCIAVLWLDPIKTYNGYDLQISKRSLTNGYVQYNAYARKGNFRYEVNASVNDEQDFENFLISFLI